MNNIEDFAQFPNIKKRLAQQLRNAGIDSYQDLADMGSIEAIIKIKGKAACRDYNLLFALEGAIQGIPQYNFFKEEKLKLKTELNKAIKRLEKRANL